MQIISVREYLKKNYYIIFSAAEYIEHDFNTA